MFSDIVRDDVFRLETRNLWLRWPLEGDAARDLASPDPAALPEDATGDPYRSPPSRRPDVLAAWRRANASGSELHVLMTGRGHDRQVIGATSLVPVRGRPEDCGLRLRVWLAAGSRGRGFATEAVQAMVDAAFLLAEAPLVSASSLVLDPAFRRVLEKCGFASCGTGLDPGTSGHGLVASDRFRLDRKAWRSLKGWRMPGLVSESVAADPGLGCSG